MLEELNVVEWLQKPYSNNTRTWDVRLRTNPEGVWTLDILAVNPNADPILHGRMLSIRIPAALAIVDRASLQAHNAENARMESCIAELEAEAAAFDTALWSGRLQEVEQYNVNANARIAELEAQVAEMQPVTRLEEWANEFGDRRYTIERWEGTDTKEYVVSLTVLQAYPADNDEYEAIADTLPAAISAALKMVEGENNAD